MGIIPIVAEILDIMPGWLKYTLFLTALLGASVGLVWAFDIRYALDQILMWIGAVFGIGYLSFSVFVILSFLTVPLLIMFKLGRSNN